MHVRIRTRRLQPGKLAETTAVWRDQMGPFLKQQNGFKGVYLAADERTEQSVSISFWESEADASALDSNSTCRELVKMLAQYEAMPSTQEQYEVCLQVSEDICG